MIQKAPVDDSSGLRRLTRGPVGIALGVGLLVVSGIILWMFGRGSNAADIAANRNFICAETGETFAHTIKPGESYPIINPKTGRPTGYPAELCYWTRDGKAKLEPTRVLLNQYAGKEGPTICPDCGREVRPHNPPPPPELMREALEANRRN